MLIVRINYTVPGKMTKKTRKNRLSDELHLRLNVYILYFLVYASSLLAQQ